MKVLVRADNDRDVRVANALASEPGIELALIGTGRSNRIPTVELPAGFDVVIGAGTDVLQLAQLAGAAAITAVEVASSPVPTVAGASLLGAGLAIAARLDAEGSDVLRVGIAQPGNGTLGGVSISFPAPVGRTRGTVLMESPFPVVVAASHEPWAGISVETNTGDQAVVDEHRFLVAVCLAAGIALIPPAGIVKVWDGASAYLARAEEMGLVAAQRTSP
jgi:hypothetical protein